MILSGLVPAICCNFVDGQERAGKNEKRLLNRYTTSYEIPPPSFTLKGDKFSPEKDEKSFRKESAHSVTQVSWPFSA